MKIDYFTSTSNSPAKKIAFCGRCAEIETIIDGISKGKNIAIIGQRRIGKTFLRFILNDILSQKCNDYVDKLIDNNLATQLHNLSSSLPEVILVDISLHEIRDGRFFYYYIVAELFEQGVLVEPLPTGELTLLEYNKLFRSIVLPFLEKHKKRLVLVLDEFDVILEYKNSLEILGHLKTLSEQQQLFSFVFFGWNGIQKRIWECYNGSGESPFPECIDTKIYLTPLNYNESEVLAGTLQEHFPQDEINETFKDNIYIYTGGRAYFIQTILEHIVTTGDTHWLHYREPAFRQETSKHIFGDSSRRAIIQSFWGNDSAQESLLLTYIAHYPGTTSNQLHNFFSAFNDCDISDCLEYFDKTKMIDSESGQLTLHGAMLEHWGQGRKENPTVTANKKEISQSYSTKEAFTYVDWTPPSSETEFIGIIDKLIAEFQFYVKEKKGNQLLWLGDAPAPEVNAQILFDLLTEQYSRLADINTDREIETGRGPVDFKFSKGQKYQALLEVKRATSSQLEHGLEKQLPTYLHADRVTIGFYVVICYDEVDIKKAEELTDEAKTLSDSLGVNLLLYKIEAFKKIPSASKV